MKIRSFASAVLGMCAVPLVACSVSTTPNSVTVKTQPETDGPAQTKSSQRAWKADDIIEIANANGAIVVHGDPNATTLTVTTTPMARSDAAGDADAQATINDVIASITIDESQGNKFYIHCDHGQTHGTSSYANSGCKDLTVTIPAGSAQAGLTLKAATNVGDVSAPDALVAKAGQQLIFSTGAGSVTVANVNGGVQAHSDVGDATVTVTPQVGSKIEVSSGNGDVTLMLPASFAADQVTLKGTPVTVTGFGTDFTSSSTSRGAAGTGASSVAVTTDLGSCTVKAH